MESNLNDIKEQLERLKSLPEEIRNELSNVREDFKNQHFVDQKSTLVDLIYSESIKCIFKDWRTTLQSGVEENMINFVHEFLMRRFEKMLRVALTSNLVNKC